MASNTSPVFTKTPGHVAGQVSVANTGRDGSGTLATLVTAGADGHLVYSIRVTATVTTTAGMVRIFVDTSGTIRLELEIPIPAITVGANTPAFSRELRRADGSALLVLESGQILKASTEKAEAINVIVQGGSLTA